jgi:DeoR/GlpR family transcriptional regulator of sugar metabolism
MAGDVVFLADHSKLGQKSAFFFTDVEHLTCLVTDMQADPEFLSQLRERGVEVLQEI